MSMPVVSTVCSNIHSAQMPRLFQLATVLTTRCTFLTLNTTGSCECSPTRAPFVGGPYRNPANPRGST